MIAYIWNITCVLVDCLIDVDIGHPSSYLYHLQPFLQPLRLITMTTPEPLLSSAQVAALVRTIDPILQEAACAGMLPLTTYQHRKDLVSAPRVLTGRRGTEFHQKAIVQHPEAEMLRLTIPAYLWGFTTQYQDLRKAGKLSREFYRDENTRLQYFHRELALGGSPASALAPSHSHPPQSPQQEMDLSAGMRHMSISPEDCAAGGSQQHPGRRKDDSCGTGAPPLPAQPSADANTQGEQHIRGFNEINEERNDVDMEAGRPDGPAKRKCCNDNDTEWEEPHDASTPTKEVKRCGAPSGPPCGNSCLPRRGTGKQGGSGGPPRAVVCATDTRNDPPCGHCIERHLLCVEQVLIPKDTCVDPAQGVTIIYDIACQYMVHLRDQLGDKLLAGLQIDSAIGLFHVHAHKDECLFRYATLFIPGAGVTAGKILESLWSGLNGISPVVCTATLAHCAEVLDDHACNSNHKKALGIARYLSRRQLQACVTSAKAGTYLADVTLAG